MRWLYVIMKKYNFFSHRILFHKITVKITSAVKFRFKFNINVSQTKS